MKIWIVSSLGCGNYSREETIQGLKLFAEILYPKYLGLFGQIFRKSCEVFRVYFVGLSAQILSLCIIGFALIVHLFYKKLSFSYILKEYIFGIGIWVLVVQNLGSSQHVSVVRGLANNLNRISVLVLYTVHTVSFDWFMSSL